VDVKDVQLLRSALAVIVQDLFICDRPGMTDYRSAYRINPILLFLHDNTI
jgi:hypothetical protein